MAEAFGVGGAVISDNLYIHTVFFAGFAPNFIEMLLSN